MIKLKSNTQIVEEIEIGIKKLKSKNINPRFIIMGHLVHFNLCQYSKINKKLEVGYSKLTGSSREFVSSYKGVEVIVNTLVESAGILKDEYQIIEVVGD